MRPDRARLERLLAEFAPLTPVPLCPEIRAHQARSLVQVWEAAEAMAGAELPAPFWAYAWPAGCALARVLLDDPALVRGRTVLDFGAGGGVASLAAARAGAAAVTASDIDEWALMVTEIAATAQDLSVGTSTRDFSATPDAAVAFDVVLASDLAYERTQAPRQRAVLARAARNGATVLIADAGRTYFDAAGLEPVAEYEIDVPRDLEGVARRTARVYRM